MTNVRRPPRSGTVEVDPLQIVEERDRPAPPPLPQRAAVGAWAPRTSPTLDDAIPPPGGTVEVQAVQIVGELAATPRVAPLMPGSTLYLLTTEPVPWDTLNADESALLFRFTFGATVDEVVAAVEMDSAWARALIAELIGRQLIIAER